ncbi:nuclear transport factor 2 family protein [Micromonospora sp. NPDC003197]
MTTDIRALQQAFDDAELHADTDCLNTLLADDFTSIGERGYLLDKRQWIDRHTEFAYLSLETTEVDVRCYDRAAIVRCVQRSRAAWRGGGGGHGADSPTESDMDQTARRVAFCGAKVRRTQNLLPSGSAMTTQFRYEPWPTSVLVAPRPSSLVTSASVLPLRYGPMSLEDSVGWAKPSCSDGGDE